MQANAIHRRAGGRRKLNRQRRAVMHLRHWNLRLALWALPPNLHADESLVDLIDDLAAHLGVSRATVYRDLKAIGYRGELARRRGRAERLAQQMRARWPAPPAPDDSTSLEWSPEVLAGIIAD